MMHLKNKEFICILLLSFGVYSYGSVEVPIDRDGQCNLTPLSKTSNNFGHKLVEQLIRGNVNGNQNICVSPLSIYVALSMVYLGTGGTTADEMREVFQLKQNGIDDDALHKSAKHLVEMFGANHDEYTLNIANTIFAQTGFNIKNDYITGVNDYYHALVRLVDFAQESEKARKEINAYISKKTNGMIKDLLEEQYQFDSSTLMVLINAIYFKGTWKIQFPEDETREGIFTNKNGKSKQVPFMHLETTDEFPFYEDTKEEVSYLELAYKGEDVSMLIALPFENSNKGLSILKSEDICRVMSSVEPMAFDRISMPKFKLRYKTDLSDVLASLGIKELFNSPDLSRISDDRSLALSEVVHEAVIDVNEKGSEAAAATAVLGNRMGYSSLFVIDRPFVFYIIDKRSNLVLFVGHVNDP